MPEDTSSDPETCRVCTAICADGSRCRAWAVHGSDPPRCAPHGGGARPVGAPEGNHNARTHGFFLRKKLSPPGRSRAMKRVENTLADLCVKHLRLVRYIEERKHELSVTQLDTLFRLHRANLEQLIPLFEQRYGPLAGSPADIKAIVADILRDQGHQVDDSP